MVKPDVKHNYYADLDLPNTATIDDIRKAYRKLALSYHPDRNAGKEDECVPRFQAIQAANEVLSDPITKAKYDQDRRKAGLYPTGPTFKANAPAPGNPYAASSAYPPPPRRTQPGTWSRPTAAGQPTGADRFTNFPRPANAMPRKDPAAERTQQFRAWQNMNTAGGPTSEKPRYPNPGPPPPPRSPNPQTQQQQNTARPRMPRQDTKMPTEEQIKASMRYGNGPAPAAEKQTAWQAFQTSNAGKPGMSNKRPQRGAPTTPKRPGGFDPNAPGSDERPAPQSTGHYVHRHKSSDLGSDGFPPPPPGPPPTSAPHSPISPQFQRPSVSRQQSHRGRTLDADVPYAEANRQSTPYASFIGEKLQTGDGLRRSASTRDTTRLQPESNISSTSRARSSSPPLRQTKTAENGTSGAKKAFTPGTDSDSSDGSSKDDFGDGELSGERSDSSADAPRPNHAQANASKAPADRPKRVPKPPSSRLNGSNLSSDHPSPRVNAGHRSDSEQLPSMQQRKSSTNIFSFPVNGDSFSSTTSKSRSFDNINTKFSPDGWNPQFTGTPTSAPSPDYFSATGRKPSPARRAPSSRGNRANTHDGGPTSNGNTSGTMGPPPRPDGTQTQPSSTYASPTDVKFDEEQWKSTFKDPSWTWKSDTRNDSQGDARTKTPSRKSSRVPSKNGESTAGTQEQPHIVIDEPEDVDSGDAMDIDHTPPAGRQSASAEQTTPSQPQPSKEPRYVSVEPSEWQRQQQQHSAQSRSPGSHHVRNATEPKLRTNLDDLAHVEPIAKSAEGLRNLADLSSTLPFQSSNQSSADAMKPQKLATPAVPKPPTEPGRLSKQSWHIYVLNFHTYLEHFNGFNKIMLAHFDTRQKQADARMLAGTGWLEAAGDTTSQLGWGSYYKGVLEDEQVRATWDLGCERHLDACKNFDRLRERVRKLSYQGALPDA